MCKFPLSHPLFFEWLHDGWHRTLSIHRLHTNKYHAKQVNAHALWGIRQFFWNSQRVEHAQVLWMVGTLLPGSVSVVSWEVDTRSVQVSSVNLQIQACSNRMALYRMADGRIHDTYGTTGTMYAMYTPSTSMPLYTPSTQRTLTFVSAVFKTFSQGWTFIPTHDTSHNRLALQCNKGQADQDAVKSNKLQRCVLFVCIARVHIWTPRSPWKARTLYNAQDASQESKNSDPYSVVKVAHYAERWKDVSNEMWRHWCNQSAFSPVNNITSQQNMQRI